MKNTKNTNLTIIENLSKKEARDFFMKNNMEIDYTPKMSQKLSNIRQGFDFSKLDADLTLRYGGYPHGVITDKIEMIIKKDISQKLYLKYWNKNNNKNIKKYINKYDNNNFLAKCKKIDILNAKTFSKDFPKWKAIIPLERGTIAKMTKIKTDKNQPGKEFIAIKLESKNLFLYVDINRMTWMLKQLPNAEIRIIAKKTAILFSMNEKLAGLLMPLAW